MVDSLDGVPQPLSGRAAATVDTTASETKMMESVYVEWNAYAQDMLNGMLLSERRAAAVASASGRPGCTAEGAAAVVVYAHLPPYRRQSPQLGRRLHLVQWTCVVASRLALANATLHLAVRIIDFFMDGHDIEEPQLYLVCLTALMLASKFEEKDSRVPKTPVLNNFLEFKFPASEYTKVECLLLKYFKFNVNLVTACVMVDLLVPLVLDATELRRLGRAQRHVNVKENLDRLIKDFLDLSLQVDALVDCPASKVAFAVLLCARSALDLSPAWPDALRVFTGQTEESFAFCVSRLKEAACHITFASSPLNKRKKLRDQGAANRFREDGRGLLVSPDEGYGTPSALSPVFEALDSTEKRHQLITLGKAIVTSKRNKKRLAAPQL